MKPDDTSLASPSAGQPLCSAEAQLVAQIRRGDREAGQQFVRDYYPAIYRHLLYLTGSPDAAADLTQETFVRAWRGLEGFEGRASLRLWLHRIARREFLRALRNQRDLSFLEEAEVAAPHAAEWTEAVELREVIRKLPRAEGEIVLLHYLQGYSCEEIAEIVRAPAGTVKYRLSTARARLQRELGEGDLAFLNEPSPPMHRWAWLPLDQLYALETRLSRESARDPEAPGREAATEENMERREFLRHAAVGAAGLMLSEPEKEVIDDRLTRKVTLTVKATALADLCEQFSRDTGIALTAGPSVADDKVTLFCEKLPLRDVMRQLSRPFGYTWLRSGQALGVGGWGLRDHAADPNLQPPTPNALYRYELVQDLRSQLLEEELRNRDRNSALLELEREIEKYRPYLDLSPDQALSRAGTAPPSEKKLLEKLSGSGWGPIQMYFRLSPRDQEALRAGQTLKFSGSPWSDAQPLPADVERGVLQSQRDRHLEKGDGGFVYREVTDPRGAPLTAFPEAHGLVTLILEQSEPGHFALSGQSGFLLAGSGMSELQGKGPYAVGMSPSAQKPDNRAAHARVVSSATLRSLVSIEPPSRGREEAAPFPGTSPQRGWRAPRSDAERKLTTADVLEALHYATGLPIVSDFYTRLYPPEVATVKSEPLLDALNQISDRMRLRWNQDEGRTGGAAGTRAWLQFRSASFYDDRLKEVPHRLLIRWAASRQEHRVLSLDDLVEIAQLSDAQLDAADMAEGARESFGLVEWDLACRRDLRRHLRFVAELTPAQRREASSSHGLPFTRMSLSQQQRFISLAFSPEDEPLQSLEELDGAALRVEYTQPGWFQWRVPGLTGVNGMQYALPVEWGREGRRKLLPLVLERTPEAAQAAARPIEGPVREALLRAERRSASQASAPLMAVPEPQIVPTELDLTFFYFPGTSNKHPIYVRNRSADYFMGTGW